MKVKDLRKKLSYNRKNLWKDFADETKDALEFSEGYKKFLDAAKTEREAIDYYKEIIEKRNYTEVNQKSDNKKVYTFSREKNAAFAVIGSKPISEGVNLIVSHIDSPRIDLKQNPLNENGETKLGIFKTHYYGGIKKYQWVSTPLALHGVFITKEGKKIKVSIGEDEKDPVFIIPDILPHLARKKQYSKKLGEAVDASKLNIIANSIPYIAEDEEVKEAVKLNALVLLNEKYGIAENDFLSAELEIVPAGKAGDAGLDRSLLAGYGQDDRVCAYTSAEALFELDDKNIERTSIVYLADKEEIGSDGNTGAKSIFIIDFIADLLKYNNENNDSNTLRKTLINSQILSADVNAGIN
ncbi:MAG: aminopeptidase, partial [Candidatus Cloacimonadota bacterium]|nr:aminopeptidase [Candidatus Cloacimonadota bacterium]